jgi:acetyl-CoA C-acetyltransferase
MSEVYVESFVIHEGWANAEFDLTELIFNTVRETLDRSRIDLADIESVVLAAHDLVDGRGLTSMVTAPSAACYMRDEIRLGDDSLAAIALAADRIAGGEASHSIVAAWGRYSEGQPSRISATLFDPFFVAPFGIDEIQASAMRAQKWLAAYPRAEQHRESAAAERIRRSKQMEARNTGPTPAAAYPLRENELPRWADIVVAMILTSSPTDLKIAGIGQSAEAASLGERSLLTMPALAQATNAAMTMWQGTPDQVSGLESFEIDGLTMFDEAIAVESAGIAMAGNGLAALVDDRRINQTGGSAAGYAAPAMGLVRLGTLAERMRAEGLANGLATGSSVTAAQTQTAVILEAVK